MTTANYAWSLPIVGGNQNQWGTMLNTILTDIDAKMVSKTDAQTLTNKTLAAPVITGGASISGNVSVAGDSSATGTIYSSARGTSAGFMLPDWRMYNTSSGNALAFNNGSDRMTLDGSGNFGLGVTPSAWSVLRPIQIGNAAISGFGTQVSLHSNNYYNGTNFIYSTSAAAALYQSNAGAHFWSTAPSGTAGNAIPFTQAMTLDGSGNLMVKKTALSNTGRGAYIRADNGNGSCICSTGDGTTSAILFLGNEEGAGAQRFVVLGNGNVQNTNNSYGAISSKLYKENIADASPKLAKLLKVRIVNYNLINDPAKLKQLGVIWEELNEISPGLCEEAPDYEEVTLLREVEKFAPVTVKKEVTTERVQMDVIDGVAVQKVIIETTVIDDPVVDEYPVFDGDGNPVMEVVTPATDTELDDKGNEVKAAMPAVLRQKIHTVPRMETVVEKEEYTERRLTGTTTKSVKYSIFVPMLIKAVQEHVEETRAGFALHDEAIAALTARIEALEARA